MSLAKNGSIRCDWCGRLTGNKDGEYTAPDGASAHYIRQPEWERFPGGRTDVGSVESDRDICEECESNKCLGCGSGQIVKLRPWGGKCSDCGFCWGTTAGC